MKMSSGQKKKVSNRKKNFMSNFFHGSDDDDYLDLQSDEAGEELDEAETTFESLMGDKLEAVAAEISAAYDNVLLRSTAPGGAIKTQTPDEIVKCTKNGVLALSELERALRLPSAARTEIDTLMPYLAQFDNFNNLIVLGASNGGHNSYSTLLKMLIFSFMYYYNGGKYNQDGLRRFTYALLSKFGWAPPNTPQQGTLDWARASALINLAPQTVSSIMSSYAADAELRLAALADLRDEAIRFKKHDGPKGYFDRYVDKLTNFVRDHNQKSAIVTRGDLTTFLYFRDAERLHAAGQDAVQARRPTPEQLTRLLCLCKITRVTAEKDKLSPEAMQEATATLGAALIALGTQFLELYGITNIMKFIFTMDETPVAPAGSLRMRTPATFVVPGESRSIRTSLASSDKRVGTVVAGSQPPDCTRTVRPYVILRGMT